MKVLGTLDRSKGITSHSYKLGLKDDLLFIPYVDPNLEATTLEVNLRKDF